jgi:hypothetical protein
LGHFLAGTRVPHDRPEFFNFRDRHADLFGYHDDRSIREGPMKRLDQFDLFSSVH